MPNRLSALALFTAITPIAALPAIAQEGPAMDEVIVTGQYPDTAASALRMQIPIIDVPQSLSITKGFEIKQRGFRELGDLVRYTPGLNTSQGEGHRDSVVFRGVRSTADFFLDGVRDDVQYFRPLYNLEQVEVLRGPNAMLFGRGGTGGAINRVTKKAMLGKTAREVDAGVDSFGGFNAAADINFTRGDNVALRLNAFAETLENDRDFYDGDRIGFNPNVRLALNPQTKLDLSYEYMDHERFIDRGIPTQNGAPVEALRDIVFGGEDINTTTLEGNVLRGQLSHAFSDTMSGMVTLHYGNYEKTYQNLYAAGYDGTDVTLDGYRDPTERSNTVLSGHVTNKFEAGGMQHTLLIGGEYIDTQSENLRYNTYWSSSSDDQEVFSVQNPLDLTETAGGAATSVDFTTDLNTQTETDITVTSLFVQDQIAVRDNFRLLLGARLDSFDITVDDIKNDASESRKDEEISPRIGFIYKPQTNLSLYASASQSFLPRSGEQYKKLDTIAARLDPDVFENTEFGVKWDVSDMLNVTASLFDSEQTKSERDDDTGEQSEVRGLTVDGFELELRGQVTDALLLSAGYTSLNGETAGGETPRELPETMASLYAQYTASERFGFGIGLTHQSESNVKDGNNSPVLPDYTRVDASAYYNLSSDTVLRLNIENLTDELYFPHAHSTHQVSVGEPLNAQISVSRQF